MTIIQEEERESRNSLAKFNNALKGIIGKYPNIVMTEMNPRIISDVWSKIMFDQLNAEQYLKSNFLLFT